MSAGHGHIDPSNKKIALMIAVLALFTDIAFLRAPLHVRLPDLAVSHSILGAWLATTR